MTEPKEMTPEEKRIKIAEACGWIPRHNYYWTAPGTAYPLISGGNLPDYLNSLDAIHEAEKVLAKDRYTRLLYFHELLGIVCPDSDRLAAEPYGDEEYASAMSATAAQRADAFLAVIGEKP